MIERHWAASAAIVCCLAATTLAEDAYYDLAIGDLELVERQSEPVAEQPVEEQPTAASNDWRRRQARVPYVWLEGAGEAFLSPSEGTSFWAGLGEWKRDGRLAIRVPGGQAPSGRLYLPNADATGLAKFDFKIPADKRASNSDAKRAFYAAKQSHYRRLIDRNIAGAAWFRHQWDAAGAQIGQQQNDAGQLQRQNRPAREDDLESSFALFSGSRAVSENLQLDRALRVGAGGAGDVEIDKLEGISVKEIDWQPLIKDLDPELDPLAGVIPADQHAVFFPSFAALVAVADEINRQGTPLARFMETRSEDERVKERYERQLGLPLSLLARLLGGQVIGGVALTGSDPYFFAGTDIALVFEAKQSTVLKTLLLARIAAAVQGQAGVKPVQGEIERVAYSGFASPDRKVSSYVAEIGKAVVVTNSTAQLAQLAKVQQDKTAAIASLAEYKFFRGRYPRGEKDESALVFLSDATIRRWCGPRWRIADSRRVRAAGMLAELQAEQLDRLAVGKTAALYVDKPQMTWLGELKLLAGNVHSSTMGSLEFLTPIVELKLDKATSAEADAYRAWRNQYQSNWRWAFDPIALRLAVKDEQLAADLSVMPLIWGTEYRTWVDMARGAEIKPGAGDPHDALAHFVTAVNAKSEQLRQSESFVTGLVKVSPFDWLGESVAWYVDDDPFWQDFAAAKTTDEASQFMERNLHRLPIAIHCEVANSAKLILFMAGVRGLIEQVAPEMTIWETLKHNDQPYVKIGPTAQARRQVPFAAELHIYYALWSDGLVVTLNESVLKRALDRKAAREKDQAADKEPPATQPWLGSSMAMQVKGEAIAQLGRLGRSDYEQTLQLRSWDNLPILNEWRRRYPDRDPVELHEQYWHTRLVCPGGGKYVWNDQWRTMESTAFGHPGEPKSPETFAAPWQAIRGGNLGVTFEKDGLRAKAVIDREAP